MIIKEAKFTEKKVLQRIRLSDEVYGCDECRKEIKDFPNEDPRLDLKIFNRNDQCERLHFCSWQCVLKHLPKIECNYFIDLPFVHYDKPNKNAKEFLKALSKVKW